MIDIKLLRDSPDIVLAAIARKKFKVDINKVIELDSFRREKITEAEKARAEQRLANQSMALLEKGSPEFLEKVAEMKSVSAKAKELEAEAKKADQSFQEAFLEIPNLPDESVPSGDTCLLYTSDAADE